MSSSAARGAPVARRCGTHLATRKPSHASRIATRTRDTRSAERIGGGAMVGDYTVILIMILALTALGLTLLSLGIAIRPHRPTPRKLSPYEGGVPDVEPIRGR